MLATNYKLGAEKAGYVCNLTNLSDLEFNPNLRYGYNIKMELEPDLVELQKLIAKSNHLIFIFPTWWGTSNAGFHLWRKRLFSYFQA